MRVISGKAKGIQLETIEGLNTRPTTDRIKESIFNLIQFSIMHARVLDLFAGSGALGIESASRGAEHVDMVEQNRQCHTVITSNIKKTHLEDRVSLIKGEVLSVLPTLDKYDVILMDPPYNKNFILPVLEKIESYDLLNEEGIVMIEHSIEDGLSENIGRLRRLKQKKYGKTYISIYGYDN